MMLATVGVRSLTVYDADSMESGNVPMTLAFHQHDCGRRKVEIVRDRVREQSGLEMTAIPRMYAGEPFVAGSVVCCVDKMEARMEIWKRIKPNPNIDLFVDTRTNAKFISIFAVRPSEAADVTHYEHHLYPSKNAAIQTCGMHGIVTVSALAACLAVDALTVMWSGGIPSLHQDILLQTHGGMLLMQANKEKGSVHGEVEED